jgi:hypothetical protein
MTRRYFDDLPTLEDIEPATYTAVLTATSRLDQARVRFAVDAVFAAHPSLGAVFEPGFGSWTSRGGWGWGVEPAGRVEDVVARHRASFDIHTGRLFAASLLPGAPDRLVLTASQLCLDDRTWQALVNDIIAAYGEGVLARVDLG